MQTGNTVIGSIVDTVPQCIHAKLSIDGSPRKAESVFNEAGGVYGHPVTNAGETIQLHVTVYPDTATWKLTFENYSLPTENGIIHTGDAVINLPIPNRDESGFELHRIIVRPVTDAPAVQSEVTVSFWSEKKAVVPPVVASYCWSFADANWRDSVSGVTLAPVDAAEAIFPSDVAVRDRSAKIQTPGTFEHTTVPLDATNGATVMCFVRGSGNQSRVGFLQKEKNSYEGNSLLIEWSYKQPGFWMPRKGYNLRPELTAGNRWADTASWHHLAETITPIENLPAFPGVVYNEAADTYTWTSETLGGTATRTWPAHYSSSKPEGVDGNDFYLVRSFVDGILMQEMIFPELKTLRNSSTHCLRNLGNGYFLCRLNQSADYVDEITVTDYPLSAAQIVQECVAAGIAVGLSPEEPETPRPVTKLARPNKPADIRQVRPQAHLKAWVIDARTIAVAGDYMDWFRERLLYEFGDDLPNIEWNYRNAGTQAYVRNWYYQYGLWTLYGDYQPLIRDKYDSSGFFSVNDTPVTLIGRWSNSNREVQMPDLLDGTEMVRSCNCANIIPVAYLSLPFAMTPGTTYTITDDDGNSTALTYGPSSPSVAIKVNQSGYSPDAGRKYAYLGFWLGTGGAYLPESVAETFQICSTGDDAVVFSGVIAVRKDISADTFSVDAQSYQLTGEKVWELEFSQFNTPGEYRLHIDGIGYSYPFVIGVDGIGRQFFNSMWGMFQQRSGCAKVSPYTRWESPYSGQQWSFESKFCSLNGYRQNAYKTQTLSDVGESYSTAYPNNPNFSMIKNNRTGQIFRELHGGWMDATDYDRRGFHLQAVDFFTFSYLLFPENFVDNQLQIPESGDGIPDLLSEAEWGLDVWRRSQYANGGIGGWIEASRHEASLPWTSSEEYCLALPSRHDSLKYAFSAARFARCLRHVNTPLALAKAAIYQESAIRAFDFGADPANRCTFDFTQDGIHWTHTEDNSEADIYVFRAAAALYVLTGQTRFTDDLNDSSFASMVAPWTIGFEGLNYTSPELLFDLAEDYPAYHAEFRARMLEQAHSWLGYQNEHAYRWLFWGPAAKAGYVRGGYCGWGAAHPGTRGWMLVMAGKLLEGQGVHEETTHYGKRYQIEAGIDFRNAAYLALDWAMGCNALGRSMTSGVGHNFPVWYLCSWLPCSQLADKNAAGQMIEENIPGITPYQFSNSIGYGVPYVYCLNMPARSDVNYPGITKSLFPAAINYANTDNPDEAKALISTFVPVQRQYIEVGGATVGASEYTVWETMAPLAALAGCLMGTGFMPTENWKLREPVRDRYALDGYIFLP